MYILRVNVKVFKLSPNLYLFPKKLTYTQGHSCVARFKKRYLTMWLWRAIVRSKAESWWSASIHCWYLKKGRINYILYYYHITQVFQYCNCNSDGLTTFQTESMTCDTSLNHREEHSLSVDVNPASVRTLTSPYGSPAERKGLRGGVGSPGEMTTSWASSGEDRSSWKEELPGPSVKIIWEPLGSRTTSARCWIQRKWET